MDVMRSKPIPVSTCLAGSDVSEPSASRLNCTRPEKVISVPASCHLRNRLSILELLCFVQSLRQSTKVGFKALIQKLENMMRCCIPNPSFAGTRIDNPFSHDAHNKSLSSKNDVPLFESFDPERCTISKPLDTWFSLLGSLELHDGSKQG